MIHLFELINRLNSFDELTADKVYQFIRSSSFEEDFGRIADNESLKKYRTLLSHVMRITGLNLDHNIDDKFTRREKECPLNNFLLTNGSMQAELEKDYDAVNDKLQSLASVKVITEAKSGNKDVAEKILARSSKLAMLLIKDEHIEQAVKNKEWEFAKWLIEKSERVSVTPVKVKNTLYRLAFYGQAELFKLVREKHPDSNLGLNILHCAVVAASATAPQITEEVIQRRNGGLAIATSLLKEGNLVAESPFSLIRLWAEFNGNGSIIEIRPILHIALSADFALLTVLIQHRHVLDVQEADGLSSLNVQDLQKRTALFEAVVIGHQQAVGLFLAQKDVALNLIDKNNITALSLIIDKLDQENYYNIAKMLADKGINLSVLTLEQLAILMEKLLEKGDQKTLEAVLTVTGSNPQKAGKSLLEVLVQRDSQALISYLIEQTHVDVNQEIVPGRTVYDLAMELNQEKLVELLKGKGAKTKDERDAIVAELQKLRSENPLEATPPPVTESQKLALEVKAKPPGGIDEKIKNHPDYNKKSFLGSMPVWLISYKLTRFYDYDENEKKFIPKNGFDENGQQAQAIQALITCLETLPPEIKDDLKLLTNLKNVVKAIAEIPSTGAPKSKAEKLQLIQEFESKYQQQMQNKILPHTSASKKFVSLIFALVGVVVGAAVGFAAGMLIGGGIGPQAVATGLYGLVHGSYTGWAVGTAAAIGGLGLVGGVTAGFGYYSFFGKSSPYIQTLPLGKTMLAGRQVVDTCNGEAASTAPQAVK